MCDQSAGRDSVVLHDEAVAAAGAGPPQELRDTNTQLDTRLTAATTRGDQLAEQLSEARGQLDQEHTRAVELQAELHAAEQRADVATNRAEQAEAARTTADASRTAAETAQGKAELAASRAGDQLTAAQSRIAELERDRAQLLAALSDRQQSEKPAAEGKSPTKAPAEAAAKKALARGTSTARQPGARRRETES